MMSNQSDTARDMLQKQLKELDQIFQDTMQTLNIASGTERVAKWKTRTFELAICPSAGPAGPVRATGRAVP